MMLTIPNLHKKLSKLLWLIPIVLAITTFFLITKTELPLPSIKLTQTQYIKTIETLSGKDDFSQAYKVALKYEKKFPKSSNSAYYLGEILFHLGQYRDSINKLQFALKDDSLSASKKSNIYYLIGRDYNYLHDSASAIAYFQTALGIDANNFLAYDSLGMEFMTKREYKNALDTFNTELSIIPDNLTNPLATSPYYNLAAIYLELGDHTNAQKNINFAEKLSAGLTQPVPTLLLAKIASLKLAIDKMGQ
ncbi:MAG TPA: hypothetical protein PK547_00185 [Candidatus Paceibacterota bacterium]|nr:hypothetical protein [Candidatus Paceibacterota bacterium]HPR91151.1 hypothetical protein [Candidatus Paceibacterota bacterium]